MPIYVLMSRLGADVMEDPRGRKVVGKEWMKRAAAVCPEVKWIAHYALLGPYDFMDIYEAPSDEHAHKISLLSRSSGAITAESWPAIAYDQFVDLAAEVEEAVRGT
jgi:uncharacterized protein with GYD domain